MDLNDVIWHPHMQSIYDFFITESPQVSRGQSPLNFIVVYFFENEPNICLTLFWYM